MLKRDVKRQKTVQNMPHFCTKSVQIGEAFIFLNAALILGLKKHHFGAWAGTRKKIIEVQDKKREKMGVLGVFWQFWPLLVKIGVTAVYYSGHCWNARH